MKHLAGNTEQKDIHILRTLLIYTIKIKSQ